MTNAFSDMSYDGVITIAGKKQFMYVDFDLQNFFEKRLLSLPITNALTFSESLLFQKGDLNHHASFIKRSFHLSTHY